MSVFRVGGRSGRCYSGSGGAGGSKRDSLRMLDFQRMHLCKCAPKKRLKYSFLILLCTYEAQSYGQQRTSIQELNRLNMRFVWTFKLVMILTCSF